MKKSQLFFISVVTILLFSISYGFDIIPSGDELLVIDNYYDEESQSNISEIIGTLGPQIDISDCLVINQIYVDDIIIPSGEHINMELRGYPNGEYYQLLNYSYKGKNYGLEWSFRNNVLYKPYIIDDDMSLGIPGFYVGDKEKDYSFMNLSSNVKVYERPDYNSSIIGTIPVNEKITPLYWRKHFYTRQRS